MIGRISTSALRLKGVGSNPASVILVFWYDDRLSARSTDRPFFRARYFVELLWFLLGFKHVMLIVNLTNMNDVTYDIYEISCALRCNGTRPLADFKTYSDTVIK